MSAPGTLRVVGLGMGRVAVLALAASAGLWGCIIPDADIDIEDQFVNKGAVRLVEPTPVTQRADDSCDELPGVSTRCPNQPDTVPSGLIRPDPPLCVCTQGDLGLGGFDIFVEDPDADDDIIGAFFLDMPTDPANVQDYLAYTNQLPPEEPAQLFRASDSLTIERPDPNLRAWAIAGQSRWDLCNDNNAVRLSVGLHQIQLIVTDRPWYRPQSLDAAGRPVRDEDGNLVLGEPVIGMPDLAAGATYDTTHYVFECHDEEDEEVECSCDVV